MNKTGKILLGLLVSNAAALILMAITRVAVDYANSQPYNWPAKTGRAILIGSDFFIIPLLMGILSAYMWRNLELRGVKYLVYSLYNSLIAILMSWLFMGEGYICLLIVSPL